MEHNQDKLLVDLQDETNKKENLYIDEILRLILNRKVLIGFWKKEDVIKMLNEV